MATQPDDHQLEAAIAAALLLTGRRYDLPALIRRSGNRTRPYRRIVPTSALQANIAAPYFDIVRAWRAERDRLLAAYVNVLPARGQQLGPDATSTLQRQIDASAARITSQFAAIDRKFASAFASMERWHRSQWVARVKAGTGLDVSILSSPSDVEGEVSNGLARNEQLSRALHSEIHSKIGTAMSAALVGFVAAPSLATQLNGLLDTSKARAARIGVDQTETISAGMDRGRRRAAGLNRFRWRHYNQQPHPRAEHVLRDMRLYTEANAPKDRAGVPYNCRCWEEPLWE